QPERAAEEIAEPLRAQGAHVVACDAVAPDLDLGALLDPIDGDVQGEHSRRAQDQLARFQRRLHERHARQLALRHEHAGRVDDQPLAIEIEAGLAQHGFARRAAGARFDGIDVDRFERHVEVGGDGGTPRGTRRGSGAEGAIVCAALPTILAMERFDVQVSGAGIVGKSLALSLSRLGHSVALRGTPTAPARDDVRAYALNAASVVLLQRLKVWDSLGAGATTPVHDMVVHGDSASGQLEFSAWEQRVGTLAVITDAAAFKHAPDTALGFAPHVTRTGADVAATLVAHCEGRGAAASLHALDAGFERSDYGQKAIAARLVATLPHRHVARQWFRSPDVLALLPFDRPEAGHSYALVWSLPSDRADALLAIDADGFARELAQATGGEAGELAL